MRWVLVLLSIVACLMPWRLATAETGHGAAPECTPEISALADVQR